MSHQERARRWLPGSSESHVDSLAAEFAEVERSAIQRCIEVAKVAGNQEVKAHVDGAKGSRELIVVATQMGGTLVTSSIVAALEALLPAASREEK